MKRLFLGLFPVLILALPVKAQDLAPVDTAEQIQCASDARVMILRLREGQNSALGISQGARTFTSHYNRELTSCFVIQKLTIRATDGAVHVITVWNAGATAEDMFRGTAAHAQGAIIMPAGKAPEGRNITIQGVPDTLANFQALWEK